MTDDDLTPDPETAAADAADDAHTERWREERARFVDPLCPCAMHGEGWEPRCVCRRLMRAREESRADERERAAGRVEARLGPADSWTAPGELITRSTVLAAIREGGA